MNVHPDITIKEFIDQFSKIFDHLRLEFYTQHHQENEGSPIKSQLDHALKLKEINKNLKEAQFDLNPEMSVSDFETMMFEKFKLNVQVFRNSAGLWLQTTSTDHWSLSKQNGKGQRSNQHYDIEPPKIQDFDLL